MIIIVIKVDIRMFLEWENNSRKLQIISWKFQNNAINDIKQISLSHVIKYVISQERGDIMMFILACR